MERTVIRNISLNELAIEPFIFRKLQRQRINARAALIDVRRTGVCGHCIDRFVSAAGKIDCIAARARVNDVRAVARRNGIVETA